MEQFCCQSPGAKYQKESILVGIFGNSCLDFGVNFQNNIKANMLSGDNIFISIFIIQSFFQIEHNLCQNDYSVFSQITLLHN